MHRGAEPEEMAGMVLFLCSDAASYITGQAYAVDGGQTARGLLPIEEQVGAREMGRMKQPQLPSDASAIH